ncbi:hypothetical protein JL101_036425 (plasmid) [Skermanella rosea]|uniref:hypothetical protein n=1 Tax=Skermanella rosea TaxID=1817965 RepID=UPI0019327570|nr:hypothetical protein [Skermanella rosea]UEM08230.1 hypothetical protein JL101_036425 [Skermanella rosea]
MAQADETVPLPDVPRLIREMTGHRVTYGDLYRRVLDGDLPAQRDRGRWRVRTGDVPTIAKALTNKSTERA